MMTPVNRLPTDMLHSIFTLALPASYPSPVDDNSASKFFTSTVPHNTSRVCRSWRNTILSSPLLWSTFFLSLSDPSDETLKLLIIFIKDHLRQSHDLPLTTFVRLEGIYNHSLSQAIVPLLSIHRARWRRVGIWFETIGGKRRTPIKSIPVPKTQLFIEDLALLEEFHISFSTEYIVTSSATRSLRNSLPSLTRLDLYTPDENREAMRWLDLAPNLKELTLNYGPKYSSDYASHPSYPPSYNIVIPQIHLTHLRIVNQTYTTTPAIVFILKHMSCPALEELHLDPGFVINNDAIRALCEFLRRSEPSALGVAHLCVSGRSIDPDSVAEALTLMPYLRTFSIMGWNDDWNSITILLNALSRIGDLSPPTAGFAVLPALENLEIISSRVPPLSLIELIMSRHSVDGRSFKCVTLSRCSAGEDVVDDWKAWNAGAFSNFNSDEGLDRLPDEWKDLKTLISEGLRFVVMR